MVTARRPVDGRINIPPMRHLIRFLLSPFTIIAMMGAVGTASLMGTIIPQSVDKTPRFLAAWQAANPFKFVLIRLLQLDRIYTSVWFLTLIGIIACSLTCSLYYQIKRALRAQKLSPDSKTNPKPDPSCRANVTEKILRRVMRQRGYRPFAAGASPDNLIFIKNKAGKWGGVVFHLGLLCIILAGLWNASLQQRGLAILTVGETFTGQTGKWATTRTGALAGAFTPRLTARLAGFQPRYWNSGQVKTIRSTVSVTSGGGKSRIIPISINHPGYINGIKLFLSGDYGYALDLLLNSKSSHPILAHILLAAPARPNEAVLYDMTIPTTVYRLHINFHPDRSKPSMLLTSPSADLAVSVPEMPPLKTRLLPGQSIALPMGDTLTFNKVSYWTGIIFAKSYGIPLLYAGFGLCIAGAFLLYALPVKVACIQISPVRPQRQRGGAEYLRQISISGRTRRFQALFGLELQEIAIELQAAALVQ